MTTGAPEVSAIARRPKRLATAVLEELIEHLVTGAWTPGVPIPPEPVLCQTFAVSRTVIREAVKQLESCRMVKVQQGQGTTPRPLSEWDLLNPTVLAAVVRHDEELAILDDLVDVRRALESQMAGQAALNWTDSDQAAIDARLADLHTAVEDGAAFRRADVAFHDAIQIASGNRLGRSVIQTLTEQAYRSMRYIGEPDADECRLSNKDHAAIRDAILARSAEDAEVLMDRHILTAWHRRRPTAHDVKQATRR